MLLKCKKTTQWIKYGINWGLWVYESAKLSYCLDGKYVKGIQSLIATLRKSDFMKKCHQVLLLGTSQKNHKTKLNNQAEIKRETNIWLLIFRIPSIFGCLFVKYWKWTTGKCGLRIYNYVQSNTSFLEF